MGYFKMESYPIDVAQTHAVNPRAAQWLTPIFPSIHLQVQTYK